MQTCTSIKLTGERCSSAPLRGEALCFWHSPEHAEAASEARRLGGLRRRKEGNVAGSFDFEGLRSVGEIRRLVEIVCSDALSMENSVARGRLLIAAAQAAAKLLEVGELEDRLRTVEAALRPRITKTARMR